MKKSLNIIVFIFVSVFIITISKTNIVKATIGETPTIELINSETIYLKIGTEYIEYGATAYDLEDGDITSNIITDNSALNINSSGTYSIIYSVTDSQGNQTSIIRQIIVFDTLDYVDFGEPINYQNDSSYPWTSVNIDERTAFQSNNESDDTTSSISINVNGTAFVSFEWKVSSESEYDLLKYYVNGVEKGRISGNTYWETKDIELGEGDNTITWQYSKDGSVSSGSDRGYIANVKVISVNINDATTTINESFNYYDSISIKSNVTEGLDFTIKSIEGYNEKVVGYQDVVYNLDVFYKDQTYNLRLTRRIVVELAGVEDGITYNQVITPTLGGGTATLNGEVYFEGTEINKVGNHTLTVIGVNGYTKTINFQIIPSLNDGEVLYDTFTPNIEADSMTLNGLVYQNEEITKVGTYILVIHGIGNYNQTINFKVEPVYGVVNGETYIGRVIPIIEGINASYKLNGNDYNIGDEIIEVGKHTLTVIGENDYARTIEFTVKEQVTNLVDKGVYNYSVKPIIPNVELKLNDEVYTSGTVINTVGNHTLKLIGVNGYISTYSFTITELVTNLVDEGVYTYSVKPFIPNANLYLDGVEYTSGTEIFTVGHHVLTVEGNDYVKHYCFTIDFLTSGVEDGDEYYEPISPTFSGGTATLNGVEFTSGTEITQIGNYNLTITGTNGFSSTFNFQILPSIKNNDIYNKSLKLNINTISMTLNGQVYQNEEITKVGSYILIINGTSNYTQTINFTIEPVYGVVDGGSYVGRVIPIIEGNNASYKLDGTDYNIGTEITELGKHTLIVIGENDYSRTIEFTVEEQVINIENDGVYNYSVTPSTNLPSYTLKLNGNLIENNVPITRVGYNELTIIGSDGYSITVKFTILNNANAVNGKKYTEPVLIEKIDAKMFLNGVEVTENTLVNKQGKYKLEIIGEGGYTEVINFEYYNYNLERAGIIAIPITILLGTTLFLFKLRKKVI